MGIFSSDRNQNQTYQTSYNEQIALQGDGQVGRIQGSNNKIDISISDGSVESIFSSRDVALFAIEKNSTMSGLALEVARDSAKNSADLAGYLGGRALDTANHAINGSQITTVKALESLLAFQERAGQTVDDAVGAAQDIAKNAAPVSPGAYLQASEARSSDNQKTLYYAIAAVLIIGFFATRNK